MPRNRQGGASLYEHLAYSGVRSYQGRLSPARIQNLLPSTATTCRRFARRHGIRHSSIKLDDGTVAHQLGPSDATHRVVFFHGGGYMAPALSTHIDFAFGFHPPRKHVAVYVLQYSLVTETANQYPLQLQQAVSLLAHLIHAEGVAPSAMTLVGDSAGGHLLLGLALHLRHPNPRVPPLSFKGRFAGAAVVSPWLNLHADPEDMAVCERQDVIERRAVKRWAANWLCGAPSDCWNDPLTAPADWWADVPIDGVFLAYGEDELLRDGCAALAEVLKTAHRSVAAYGVQGELHVQMIMNRFLRLNKPCASEDIYARWMQDRLAAKPAQRDART